MARVNWGLNHNPYYSGLSQGVLYFGNTGVPWNGLIAVSSQPEGEVSTDFYYDGKRTRIEYTQGGYKGSAQVFTYPDILDSKPNDYYGLCYLVDQDDEWELHLIYDILLTPQDLTYASMTNRATPGTFNFSFEGVDTSIPYSRSASRLVISSKAVRKGYGDNMESLIKDVTDILYGTSNTNPRLPSPADLIALFGSYLQFRVIYHGDGSYTIEAPDEMLVRAADGSFVVDAPSVEFLDEHTFMAWSG